MPKGSRFRPHEQTLLPDHPRRKPARSETIANARNSVNQYTRRSVLQMFACGTSITGAAIANGMSRKEATELIRDKVVRCGALDEKAS